MRDIRGLVNHLLNDFKQWLGLVSAAQRPQRQISMPANSGEEIVEIVRHARRHVA